MSARTEAKLAGKLTYSNGKPCKVGHIAERYVTNCECIECVREKNAKHYQDNFESHSARNKRWKQNNRAKASAIENNRRALLLNAMPKWLSKDDKDTIDLMYSVSAALTMVHGKRYEVDHEIPLRGKNVCGLHIPANLRVISAHENRKKYNTYG
jgi:hypothetical protein